jgi:hypothetical protein
VVQDVEELGPELELRPLAELEVLQYRESTCQNMSPRAMLRPALPEGPVLASASRQPPLRA